MAATHDRFRESDLSIEVTDRDDDGVLDDFFAAYDQAFVLPNEKEEISGFRDCLALNAGPEHERLRALYGPFREIVLVARDDTHAVVGGANFIVIQQPDADPRGIGYTVNLNYLFVAPSERGKGRSRTLLAACGKVAGAIAAEWRPSVESKGLVFLELNDPFRQTAQQYERDSEHAGIDQVDRLSYWARKRTKVLDWPYVQPALSGEQADDTTLALAVLDTRRSHLPARLVAWHLERFFAISVLKGAALASSPSAAVQVQRLHAASIARCDPGLLGLATQGLRERLRCAQGRPNDLMGALRGLGRERPARRTAFFTLSFLFDRQQIDDLLQDCWPLRTPARWSRPLLEQLQSHYAQSDKLHGAINPMFDDIADRARNLFLRDFLLDTPSLPFPADDKGRPIDEQAASLRNVCADVSLQLAQPVQWQTEGRHIESILLPEPIRFDGVLCRAFWMAHSNEALSYHISFEVPYRARVEDFLGLSMLQKVFFNTEGTEKLLADGGVHGWQAVPADQDRRPLLTLIEELFEQHLEHLLQAIESAGSPSGAGKGPARVKVRAWQRLVLRRRDASFQRSGTGAAEWARAAKHRRLLVVLRDAAVFGTLEKVRDGASGLRSHRSFGPTHRPSERHGTYDPAVLVEAIKQRARFNAAPVAGQPPRHHITASAKRYALALFLSGFLQNIIDFLQQDGLEVHDALVPEYPPPGDTAANTGFMIYATPSVMYEVVSSSRSLEGAGRQWIGTCPYIFLVHMMAFHNESLVLAYEHNVSRLVGHLQSAGLRSDRSAAGEHFEAVLDHAYECIRDFRLVTFEQVHKHYSFNVFRYDTEKQFFKAIEDVRGVEQRRRYWDEVLQHLTETVDGLKQNREARFQRSVGAIGLLLAGIGLVQTWLAILPLQSGAPEAASQASSVPNWLHGLALTILLIGLVIGYRHFAPRRGKATGRAWRSYVDEPPAQPEPARSALPGERKHELLQEPIGNIVT